MGNVGWDAAWAAMWAAAWDAAVQRLGEHAGESALTVEQHRIRYSPEWARANAPRGPHA
jgi:hypothetical protein